MAFVGHIATNRYAFRLWLIIIAICLVSTIVFELIVRRTFVEVAGGRVRYFLRLQKLRGDRPVSEVRTVDVHGMIAFEHGPTIDLLDDFKSQDLQRLMQTIKRLNPNVRDYVAP